MERSAFIKKLWRWFDEYFLLGAVAFLLLFIPLYPKIPLADLIPGYIVRLRLEDIFIAVFGLWWLIQLIRKKVTWRTPLTWVIIAYAVVGLLSNVLGVVLSHTIPAQLLHFGKSSLHWLRYLQYFSLFFMAYSAVKTKKHIFFLLGSTIAGLVGVVLYGYGQKYLYWPVYSTMNREFSKGIRLYLGEFARVQSTFAGHYDLGAYLVIVLPLLLAVIFAWGKRDVSSWKARSRYLWKLGYWLLSFTWVGGLWLLVLSASRTSFLGYLLGVGIVVLLYMLRRSLWWGISRGFLVLTVSGLMMLLVGDLTSRFSQLVNRDQYPQVYQVFDSVSDLREHPGRLLGFSDAKPPEGALSLDELEAQLNESGMTVSDTQPTTERPSDVYVDVPDREFDLDDPAATLEANIRQEGDKYVVDRQFSDCALKRSLSVCIRFETLWPRAFQGFLRDPLFGSGYATLNKESFGQFTEAESTDNNFLRTLGETGALGFLTFYGAIGLSLWYAFQVYARSRQERDGKEEAWLTALAIGSIAATAGLLLNATYIDVFAASKVAYMFWALQGVFLAAFVKFGGVAPKFDFVTQAKKQDVAQLSTLLQQVEQQAGTQKAKSGSYLSSQKRRLKSQRPRKRRQ